MKRSYLLAAGLAVVALMACTLEPAAAGDEARCIDVETAMAKQLQKLDGVGPALAKRIVDYRKKMRSKATRAGKPRWEFRNWKTLMQVKGVGAQLCKDNLEKVCFGAKVQKACPQVEKKTPGVQKKAK
ncbi:MAG: helix-hairpin-helix domain-containing protein [Deltaproteobacteria bacterium]|nr:helix-hairpin-helix domain-containing protein [Deltaproteobacteria bacterium]